MARAEETNDILAHILNYSLRFGDGTSDIAGLTHRQLRKNLRWIVENFSEKEVEIPYDLQERIAEASMIAIGINMFADLTGGDREEYGRNFVNSTDYNPFAIRTRTEYNANNTCLEILRDILQVYNADGVQAAYRRLNLRLHNQKNSNDKFLGICENDFTSMDCYELSEGLKGHFHLP